MPSLLPPSKGDCLCPSHHSKTFHELLGKMACACGNPACRDVLQDYYRDSTVPYPNPEKPQFLKKTPGTTRATGRTSLRSLTRGSSRPAGRWAGTWPRVTTTPTTCRRCRHPSPRGSRLRILRRPRTPGITIACVSPTSSLQKAPTSGRRRRRRGHLPHLQGQPVGARKEEEAAVAVRGRRRVRRGADEFKHHPFVTFSFVLTTRKPSVIVIRIVH